MKEATKKFYDNKVVTVSHVSYRKIISTWCQARIEIIFEQPNFYLWETSIAAIKQVSFTNDVISLGLYLAKPVLNPTLYNGLAKERVEGK